jgi:hypothetical protein
VGGPDVATAAPGAVGAPVFLLIVQHLRLETQRA